MTYPLGAAMLLIADTHIPYEERELGCKIPILHDVLEDTDLILPDWVEPDVRAGVEEMTYSGPEALEDKTAWVKGKDIRIKLLMLYDAFWTPYERHVGGPVERQETWTRGVAELAEEVAKQYGDLRIVQIARTVAQNTA